MVNAQVISTGFVSEEDSIYTFIAAKNTADSLTYILIKFDNDKSTSTGDRNLYVSDIYIDSTNIDSVATDYFFIPGITEHNIKYISKLNTLKFYLEDFGYDTSKVKLVEVALMNGIC